MALLHRRREPQSCFVRPTPGTAHFVGQDSVHLSRRISNMPNKASPKSKNAKAFKPCANCPFPKRCSAAGECLKKAKK